MDRRGFLLGAGAVAVTAGAALAQDAVSGLMVLTDKVTAAEKSVPEDVSRVATFAFDAGRVVTLASRSSVKGFEDALDIGDKITYEGGVFYVTRYAPANTATIETTPIPASLPAGGTLTLERRSQNLQFANCDISGSNGVVVARDCYNVAFSGGRMRDGGQFGLLVDKGAEVSVTGTAFSNNGLRRLLRDDASLSTSDIAVSEDAVFNGRLTRFEDSVRVSHNVAVHPDALGGSLEDSIFAGTPIEANLSIANPLRSGNRFVIADNRTVTGAPVGKDSPPAR